MGITFGKYTLLDKIAQGGMAEVWLAKQGGIEGFQKLVVIKKILEEFTQNDDFVKMFLDEARLAAMLNHSNVVQVYDLGNLDNNYFIAMEYIYGVPLNTIFIESIKAKKPLPIQYACLVVSQAAAGLYHAHTKKDIFGTPMNLVHRDISPQNIMVSFEGITKVVDFGIAKAATRSGEQTQAGRIKGKVSYMSPEQVMGKPLDGRSDIFALGVVLYEITTGKKIFNEPDTFKLIHKIKTEAVIPPHELIKSYPKPLSLIIMKALSKDRDKRYQSAISLSKDLGHFLKMFPNHVSSHEFSLWLQDIFKDKIKTTKERYEKLIVNEISVEDEVQKTEAIGEATQIFDLKSLGKDFFKQEEDEGDFDDLKETDVRVKKKQLSDSFDDDFGFDDDDGFDDADKTRIARNTNSNLIIDDVPKGRAISRKSNSRRRNEPVPNSNSRRRNEPVPNSNSRRRNESVPKVKPLRKKVENSDKKKKSLLFSLVRKIIILFVIYLFGFSVYIGYKYFTVTDRLEHIVRVAKYQSDPSVNLKFDIGSLCSKSKGVVCDENKFDVKGSEIKLMLRFHLDSKFLWKFPIKFNFKKIITTENYYE